MAEIYGTRESKEITLISLAETTTVSSPEKITGFSDVAFHLKGTGGVATGSAVFYVQVADNIDEDVWIDYNMLVDNVPTNGSAIVSSKTIDATGTSNIVWMSSGAFSKYVRMRCVWNTDGTYTAVLLCNTA